MASELPWFWSWGEEDAPLLLCLHGIGSCADAFVPQRPLAEQLGRRIVAWDAPGYRHSADPPAPPGFDGWAEAAAQLVTSLARDRADVLGVSWGGMTATRLALRHPELVRSLVLADSSVGAGISPQVAAAARARADDLEAMGASAFAEARTPRLLTDRAPAELREEVAALMADSVRLPGYRWATEAMADTDHSAELGSITAPTLVVVGDEDVVTPPAASAALAEGIPGARLVTIPDAGHLANQERPERFNEAVAEFLRSTT